MSEILHFMAMNFTTSIIVLAVSIPVTILLHVIVDRIKR